jgi:hypothetical protein
MEDIIGYLDEIQSQLTFVAENRAAGALGAARITMPLHR